MTFGKYLREKRKEKHFTVYLFAAAIGISVSYLSSIENGKRSAPSFEYLEKMADVLNLNSNDSHRLYDLAAESRKPPAIADDLSAYICQNSSLLSLLRFSMDSKLENKDWDSISDYIKNDYL